MSVHAYGYAGRAGRDMTDKLTDIDQESTAHPGSYSWRARLQAQ